MAATYFDITELPLNAIAGVQIQFRLTARNASGTVDTGYVGTATFGSSDINATLPSAYTFQLADAGTKLFDVRFRDAGARTLTVTDSTITGLANTTVAVRPPGWGFDDFGLLPYGDAAAGIGAALQYARVFSTKEVDITVTQLVQDNSAFLPGDALNPLTWTIQRLDTNAFFNVLGVTQISTYTYRLLTLEEFGPYTVTHRISSSTLKDTAGNLIVTPRSADFRGVVDVSKSTIQARLAAQQVAVRDIANPQIPTSTLLGGTLQVGANGDYKLSSGAELTKKLLIRRIISRPGDFFHYPASGPDAYGVGLRIKEPVPVSELPKLKKAIEQQCLREPEVQSVSAGLTLDGARNLMEIRLQARTKPDGNAIEIGLTNTDTGVIL